MRTTLSLKIPKRSVTPLIAVLLLTGTVSLGTACDDDKDYSRREHIEWSNSPEFEEALTGTLHIPVRASKEQDATPFKRSSISEAMWLIRSDSKAKRKSPENCRPRSGSTSTKSNAASGPESTNWSC